MNNVDNETKFTLHPLQVLPFLMSIVAFCSVLFLSGSELELYIKMSTCLLTSGLYFTAVHWRLEKGQRLIVDFGLGILWLFNAAIHCLLLIAMNMPKPE